MSRDDFEARVLELWTKTRVPLTRTNLLAYTKAPRSKQDRWLDEMVRAGVLELDSDDDGEILWIVRGSARAPRGAETLAEVERMDRLKAEVDRLTSGASLALRATGLAPSVPARERKSLIASGLLSLFFGPLGWLYAAPLKEAAPAIAVYLGVYWICSILPNFIAFPVLALVGVVSALAGVLYAWSYNQEGRRAPLIGGKIQRALPPLRRR